MFARDEPMAATAQPAGAAAAQRHVDFSQLYAANGERLFRFIRYRVGDSGVAEDLTAETFARAWSQLRDLRRPDAATAWLFRTARNLVTDQLRHRSRIDSVTMDPAQATSGPDPTMEEALRAGELRRVLEAIQSLGERERSVVELRLVGGLSHREIGAVLRTSEGNSAKLLHRGLAVIRERLLASTEPNPEE